MQKGTGELAQKKSEVDKEECQWNRYSTQKLKQNFGEKRTTWVHIESKY